MYSQREACGVPGAKLGATSGVEPGATSGAELGAELSAEPGAELSAKSPDFYTNRAEAAMSTDQAL